MNQKWLEYLSAQNIVVKNNQVISICESNSQDYSIENTYICDLSPLGLIRATGEEAQSFLHGQFTNDLNNVSPSNSQLSSYCNTKGRMLSIFQIYMHNADYYLILPRDVLETTIKKLAMFKLMAKIDLTDESDQFVIFGIAGPDTESTLNNLNITIPSEINHCIQFNKMTIIRLPSENIRVLFITDTNTAILFWQQMSEKLAIATSHLWDLHNILSGIPQITENISEAFIPQMTNLELIEGVSFSKGCYPGQEVVARTHYLGKSNRRMYRVNIATGDTPEPGINIYSPESGNQPVGKIVIARKISDGSSSALAVLRTEKENDQDLYLNSITGSKISVQSLPYRLNSISNQN